MCLEQPLLATQLMGDPNSSVSFAFIPGSLVRGMLVHRYYQGRQGLTESAVAHDPLSRRLFFNGETRYLHAYPLLDGDQRSLPTPRALQRRKQDPGATVYNAAHEEFDRNEAEGADTLKPVSEPFCLLDEADLTLVEPQPGRLTVHVARVPKKGRAVEDGGAVFQYDALAAGQWFGGVVLADHDEDATTIRDLLVGPAWLGRSRSAGYGRVQIELVQAEPADNWREVGGDCPALSANEPITLTLLSDTILRDGRGNYALTLDVPILQAYLGSAIKALDPARSFSATVLTGGFNSTGQTPLAQVYALAAGSTITFTPAAALDDAAIRTLEQRGIGERRAEGFGRIAFGWLSADELTAAEGSPYSVRQRMVTLTPTSQVMAQQMARRLLDLRVEGEIARFVRDYVAPVARDMPANSQLGRVRVLLRRAVREDVPLATVRAALDGFQAAGRQQFERARINGTPLWDWLEGLLADPPTHDVWEELGLSRHKWPQVAKEQAAPAPAFTRAVTLKLIEATLTGASRERKRTEDAR